MTPVALAAIGPTAFAALVWGSIALVALVFGYVVSAYAREALQTADRANREKT